MPPEHWLILFNIKDADRKAAANRDWSLNSGYRRRTMERANYALMELRREEGEVRFLVLKNRFGDRLNEAPEFEIMRGQFPSMRYEPPPVGSLWNDMGHVLVSDNDYALMKLFFHE